MVNLGKTLKNVFSKSFALRVFFLSAITIGIITISANAQSMRRNLTAPSPTQKARALKPIPEKDIDVYLGRIVRIEKNIVFVNISTSAKPPSNRTAIFFSCDASFAPASILEPLGIRHRNCVAFKVIEGTAALGDAVSVKYLAPKKEASE